MAQPSDQVTCVTINRIICFTLFTCFSSFTWFTRLGRHQVCGPGGLEDWRKIGGLFGLKQCQGGFWTEKFWTTVTLNNKTRTVRFWPSEGNSTFVCLGQTGRRTREIEREETKSLSSGFKYGAGALWRRNCMLQIKYTHYLCHCVWSLLGSALVS